jgi:tetratricopeptide (TPR) repeat protein
LRAFLEQRPVTARPPTAWYLAKRFAQRHKAATAATLAVVLALVAGITATTLMYLRAQHEYLRAQHEIERSRQVTRFLRDTLAQAGPAKALGRDSTMMREILDKTAARLDTELRDRPEVEAELRAIIGETYAKLGEFNLGYDQTAAALRLRRALSPADSEELAEALYLHAAALEDLGRSTEAEKFAREALAMRRRLFGESDLRTVEVELELAWELMKARRSWEEAEAFARRGMAVWRKNPAESRVMNAPKALAAILHNTNRHEESRQVFQEELDTLRRIHGAEHPMLAVCLDNLGVQLCRMKRFDEAEPLLVEALRQEEIFYGDHSPVASHILAGLVRVAASRQEWDAQLRHAREGLAATRKVFQPDHRAYRDAAGVLATVLVERAERDLTKSPQQTLALLDELAGSTDFQSTLKKSAGWLDCLRGMAWGAEPGRREEARSLLERGIESLRAKQKPDNEDRRRLQQAKTFLAQW